MRDRSILFVSVVVLYANYLTSLNIIFTFYVLLLTYYIFSLGIHIVIDNCFSFLVLALVFSRLARHRKFNYYKNRQTMMYIHTYIT